MKRVKDVPFFKNIVEVREYLFGTFYFFEGLVISEVNEGVSFEWKMGNRVIQETKEIFGENMPIAYISNRINTYEINPADWVKFYSHRNDLDFYSVVGKTKSSFASLVLERMFFKNSIKQFTDLEEAIEWSMKKIREREIKNSNKIS